MSPFVLDGEVIASSEFLIQKARQVLGAAGGQDARLRSHPLAEIPVGLTLLRERCACVKARRASNTTSLTAFNALIAASANVSCYTERAQTPPNPHLAQNDEVVPGGFESFGGKALDQMIFATNGRSKQPAAVSTRAPGLP